MKTKKKGVVNIKGKDYTTVAQRLIDFREDHDNYSIQTELHTLREIVDTPTNTACNEYIVKTTVIPNVKNPIRFTVGWAAERDNDGKVNKTSALENAETSAVGRALGFLGYGSDESISSSDEVERAIEKQNQFEPTIKELTELDKLFNQAKHLISEDLQKQFYAERSKGLSKSRAFDADKWLRGLLEKEKQGDTK
jgi:hypothetical protein